MLQPPMHALDSARNDLVVMMAKHGGTMADDMGILRTDVEIESPLREGDRRLLREVLVDTGAELSWAPGAVLESLGIARRKTIRFQQADGTILERWVGFAIIHACGTYTIDEIVFGEPGDLVLLGARSLEGLNLKVDLVGKRLVSAGPMLAADATRRHAVRRLWGVAAGSNADRELYRQHLSRKYGSG